MRIFAISDLHTDFQPNWIKLQESSQNDYQNDLLIVAGDIADNLDVIKKTLLFLQKTFKYISYTPGNHELWSKRESKTSLFKLNEILQFCDEVGIYTTPNNFNGVWIVPLFSWYQTDLIPAAIKQDEMLLLWSDLYFCVWDEINGCVSDFLSKLNEKYLSNILGNKVISFSHFLPRQDLLPELSRIRFKALKYVSVCPQLLTQINKIDSKIHIFGHTHINCDINIEGVRYIQNAFGYPREGSFTRNNIFKFIAES